jgi:hypothetical protein
MSTTASPPPAIARYRIGSPLIGERAGARGTETLGDETLGVATGAGQERSAAGVATGALALADVVDGGGDGGAAIGSATRDVGGGAATGPVAGAAIGAVGGAATDAAGGAGIDTVSGDVPGVAGGAAIEAVTACSLRMRAVSTNTVSSTESARVDFAAAACLAISAWRAAAAAAACASRAAAAACS